MKSLSSLIVLFFTVSPVFSIQAKTLFVSDIDDTIKVSHVLNKADAVGNVPKINNAFFGMSQAYQAYQKKDPTVTFAYVSNGLASIMSKPHQYFLRFNRFPNGQMLLRTSLKEDDFKVKTIRHLIEVQQPTLMILVGDNGEKDVDVYAQIQAEYPNIPTLVYIHQVYSIHSKKETGSLLAKKQSGFVTGIDLIRQLQSHNLVDVATVNTYLNGTGKMILRQNVYQEDGTSSFPAWMDCRDFFGLVDFQKSRPKWNWSSLWPDLKLTTKPESIDELLEIYRSKLYGRCLNGPVED